MSQTQVPVVLMMVHWTDAITTDPRPIPLVTVHDEHPGKIGVRLPANPRPITALIDIVEGGPDADFDELGCVRAIRRHGLKRLGPGVWMMSPSISSPEIGLNAFFVLCDVPEPAPFIGGRIIAGRLT